MKRFLIVAVTALSLGGCAEGALIPVGFQAFQAATEFTVDPQAVIIASNAFDAVQITATNYLRLKRCSAASTYACRDPRATKTIIASVRAGRLARDRLQQFVRDNPGQLGPRGLYDALTGAVGTLRDVLSTYQAGRS